MSRSTENIREKLVPDGSASTEPSEAVVSAVEGEITEHEQTIHRVPGKSGLVREHDSGTEKVKKPTGGKSLALVTDEKLLFVMVGRGQSEVRQIAYTNVRSVDSADGLLRSKLTVKVWGDGEYRFKVGDGDKLAAAVRYIEEASACWQRVVSAVEDATGQTKEMGECLEDGNLTGAQEAREAAAGKLERAYRYLDDAEIDPPQALIEKVETAAVEHNRTEIRNRLTRAETLITEGKHQADSRSYTGAYQRYMDARDHLESAREIARDSDIPEPPEIEAKLQRLESRLRHLEVRPMALAKQASERAEGTDKLDVEVEAWQEAFEHCRDALTAGWGTELEFEGDTWDIRLKTELIVEKLIEKRKALADEYEREGDELASRDPTRAIDNYETAIEQLEQAHQFASEFRAGDSDDLDDELDRIAAKRLDLR